MSKYTLALVKAAALARTPDLPLIAIQAANQRGLRAILVTTFNPLAPAKIEEFYAEHKEKPYFPDIVESVTGMISAFILYSPDDTVDAVTTWRELIGATNSRNAAEGTLRRSFGGHAFDDNAPVADNAFHGSDSHESFVRELRAIYMLGLAGLEGAVASDIGLAARDPINPVPISPTLPESPLEAAAPKVAWNPLAAAEDAAEIVYNKVVDRLVENGFGPTRALVGIARPLQSQGDPSIAVYIHTHDKEVYDLVNELIVEHDNERSDNGSIPPIYWHGHLPYTIHPGTYVYDDAFRTIAHALRADPALLDELIAKATNAINLPEGQAMSANEASAKIVAAIFGVNSFGGTIGRDFVNVWTAPDKTEKKD